MLSFAEFMRHALYAPGLGYYTAGSRKFGVAGDFVTAPEISSLFGYVLARQIAPTIRGLSGGDVLELGAGSGKLAADVLTRLESLDALPARYLILEISADLVERQRGLADGPCAGTCGARRLARRLAHRLPRCGACQRSARRTARRALRLSWGYLSAARRLRRRRAIPLHRSSGTGLACRATRGAARGKRCCLAGRLHLRDRPRRVRLDRESRRTVVGRARGCCSTTVCLVPNTMRHSAGTAGCVAIIVIVRTMIR